jgi:hypothetical protein
MESAWLCVELHMLAFAGWESLREGLFPHFDSAPEFQRSLRDAHLVSSFRRRKCELSNLPVRSRALLWRPRMRAPFPLLRPTEDSLSRERTRG